MRGQDAVQNAAPYYFNLAVSRAAVDAGIHCADLGGNTEIVFQQKALDAEARARSVSIIPDCGLAPGMVNILAAEGIRRVGNAEVVKIYVGGLPQHPEPPLNYQIVYSLAGALDYYTTPSWVLRDGRPARVEALSEPEHVVFPPPVGELEAFHTGGGISTLPWAYEGRVRTMEYKTLRYPGHVAIMRPIRELGLLDLTPVKVNGTDVVPRDAFITTVSPKLTKPGVRDLVALRVEVRANTRKRARGVPAGAYPAVGPGTGLRAGTDVSPARAGRGLVRRRVQHHSVRGKARCPGPLPGDARPAARRKPGGDGPLRERQRARHPDRDPARRRVA